MKLNKLNAVFKKEQEEKEENNLKFIQEKWKHWN